MQAWAIQEVCFGDGVVYDLAALSSVIITDAEHQLRSNTAENEPAAGVAKHPLPKGGRDGGRPSADSNSKDELLLSVDCDRVWKARHRFVNEKHQQIGCRGINAVQASKLLSYGCDTFTDCYIFNV